MSNYQSKTNPRNLSDLADYPAVQNAQTRIDNKALYDLIPVEMPDALFFPDLRERTLAKLKS